MCGRMGIVRGGHCRRVDGGFGDDHAGGAAGQKRKTAFRVEPKSGQCRSNLPNENTIIVAEIT